MKKLIPVLLSLLMALSVAVPAFADTIYTEGALNYTIADESITITDYFGKDAEVTVPASIAGTPVNTIAAGAFAHNDSVKKVNLPDTITSVEEGAFAAGITVNYQSNVVGGGTSIGEGDSTGSGSAAALAHQPTSMRPPSTRTAPPLQAVPTLRVPVPRPTLTVTRRTPPTLRLSRAVSRFPCWTARPSKSRAQASPGLGWLWASLLWQHVPSPGYGYGEREAAKAHRFGTSVPVRRASGSCRRSRDPTPSSARQSPRLVARAFSASEDEKVTLF